MAGNWREKIRKIDPYIPGEQSKDADIVKLNANENPYPPSPKVQEVLQKFPIDALRRYPDANSGNLRRVLAEHFAVKENQVFMGNGSDDVLALCFQTFFLFGTANSLSGRHILFLSSLVRSVPHPLYQDSPNRYLLH